MLNINSDLWGTWSQYLIIQTNNGAIEKEELLIILLKKHKIAQFYGNGQKNNWQIICDVVLSLSKSYLIKSTEQSDMRLETLNHHVKW